MDQELKRLLLDIRQDLAALVHQIDVYLHPVVHEVWVDYDVVEDCSRGIVPALREFEHLAERIPVRFIGPDNAELPFDPGDLGEVTDDEATPVFRVSKDKLIGAGDWDTLMELLSPLKLLIESLGYKPGFVTV